MRSWANRLRRCEQTLEILDASVLRCVVAGRYVAVIPLDGTGERGAAEVRASDTGNTFAKIPEVSMKDVVLGMGALALCTCSTPRDDIVDAMVATWTAERVLKKREERLPGKPVRDGRGLRMEIVI